MWQKNKEKNMLKHISSPAIFFLSGLGWGKNEKNSDLMNISCCINCPKELLKGGFSAPPPTLVNKKANMNFSCV